MPKSKVVAAAFASILGAAFLFGFSCRTAESVPAGFVTTDGARFLIDGRPFRFVGANVAIMYKDEDRERMPETLAVAARSGIKVLRVWAYGEGGEDSDVRSVGGDKNDWPRKHPFRFAPDKWNEDAFVHLDKVLAEAAKNNIKVQLCLTNWWRDTGGVTQYLKWAGIPDAADDKKPFGINVERAMQFYTNEDVRRMYKDHVRRVVERRNSVTGKLYKDDPTIMGYELMNEAQAPTGRWEQRRAWVSEMSSFIKSMDAYHLVAPGTWGYRTAWERKEWLKEHSLPTIDYCDVHNYPRDDHDSFVQTPQMLREFIANRSAAAYSINKPLVIGEFGMGPEGYNGYSEIDWYKAFFEASARDGVAGAMFWILTPDPNRGYGVSYTTDRDRQLFSEIKGASNLFDSMQSAPAPADLLKAENHQVPRQFGFELPAGDPSTIPEMRPLASGGIAYLFKPQMAKAAQFEKIGGGEGYIWGAGSGWVEYVVPGREDWRKVGSINVRAHVKPVLPVDAHPPVDATTVTLFINGVDCGSRTMPDEDPKNVVNQEWKVDSYKLRLQAARGLPLHVRFVVQPGSDKPYGLNISNYPEGYSKEEVRPIQVDID